MGEQFTLIIFPEDKTFNKINQINILNNFLKILLSKIIMLKIQVAQSIFSVIDTNKQIKNSSI